MARRSRAFRDKSPADVVRAVAAELGLDPVISELGAPTRTWAQLDETDIGLRLLMGAAEDIDIEVKTALEFGDAQHDAAVAQCPRTNQKPSSPAGNHTS